jgi:hypothetical protein
MKKMGKEGKRLEIKELEERQGKGNLNYSKIEEN